MLHLTFAKMIPFIVPGTNTFKNIIKKVIFTQTVAAPMQISSYFIFINIMENKNFE